MYRSRPRLRFPNAPVEEPFERTKAVDSAGFVRALREWADFTQSELSRRTGIRQQTISAWERGLREPTLSGVLAIAGACGLDLFVAPEVRDDPGEIGPAHMIIPSSRHVVATRADAQLRTRRELRAGLRQYRAEREGPLRP